MGVLLGVCFMAVSVACLVLGFVGRLVDVVGWHFCAFLLRRWWHGVWEVCGFDSWLFVNVCQGFCGWFTDVLVVWLVFRFVSLLLPVWYCVWIVLVCGGLWI